MTARTEVHYHLWSIFVSCGLDEHAMHLESYLFADDSEYDEFLSWLERLAPQSVARHAAKLSREIIAARGPMERIDTLNIYVNGLSGPVPDAEGLAWEQIADNEVPVDTSVAGSEFLIAVSFLGVLRDERLKLIPSIRAAFPTVGIVECSTALTAGDAVVTFQSRSPNGVCMGKELRALVLLAAGMSARLSVMRTSCSDSASRAFDITSFYQNWD